MAWCLCFLILFAVSQIFKVKGQETDYAKWRSMRHTKS
jgi:hypothetical protein